MQDQIIFLDLDNTVFPTKSMGKQVIGEIFQSIRMAATHFFNSDKVDHIIEDLWHYPLDDVAAKHEFPPGMYEDIDNEMGSMHFSLEITPFPDYKLMHTVKGTKYLITTGFPHLQDAKIDALGIRRDFAGIYIDDITDDHRIHKKGIMQKILQQYPKNNQTVWVIGDNPGAELKAGHELGLQTIQMARLGQEAAPFCDHVVHSYREIIRIIGA